MARDPDALETEQDSSNQAVAPEAAEFATGPSLAERSMPRKASRQPLWPWLVIVAAIVIAAIVYLATQ